MSDRASVSPPSSLPEAITPPRGQRVLAVGGGRGGVGKSVLSVNLGVYFAQLGRSVVICDADPYGSNLHSVLGRDRPPLVDRAAVSDDTAQPVPTSVPGLSLMPTAYDAILAAPVRPTRKTHWSSRLKTLSADYVILHLGNSLLPQSLDLFPTADVSICVAAPEPLAVETTYGFLRALWARVLRRRLMKERYKLRLVERAIATLDPPNNPREVVTALRRFDSSLATVAAREMARLRPQLVIGQTRLRADLELGPAMGIVAERHLGIHLDYLGHIEHDDAVWLTVRRRSPLLIDSPTSKSARNIERVARRILALMAARHDSSSTSVDPERVDAPLTLYEVLGLSRAAADDEIRRAYKRQREIYREGSLSLTSLVAEARLREEQSRIEEAYDTLLDPVKRRAYDISTFPDDPPRPVEPTRSASAAAQAELLMLQAEVTREIHAETIFTGELIRKVRESQGVELSDIAHRTKISTLHLKAIETETYGDLPAPVYIQGFVQQVAKYLKLDPVQVTKTYMRRMRERGRAGGA